MMRDYKDQTTDSAQFFKGIEVEKTPAFGTNTLFVVGLKSPSHIQKYVTEDITHIFFGANHSFNPKNLNYDFDYFDEWQTMIKFFINQGYLCSLDVPSDCLPEFINNTKLLDSDNFIPQIRLVIPHVYKWNKNTMIKIDDQDFKFSNKGVWSSNLTNFVNDKNFTSWEDYDQDQLLDDKS